MRRWRLFFSGTGSGLHEGRTRLGKRRVLATESVPFVPPIPGVERPGGRGSAVLGARQPEPAPAEEENVAVELIVGFSPCEKLVRKVCGREDECADTEACDMARQLQDMESQEREESTSRSLTTYTSNRCRMVESDPGLFPECEVKKR